jgi:polysaccharide export outer membrane protein
MTVIKGLRNQINQIGHTASVPAFPPVDASPDRRRHASRVLRPLGLGGALSVLLTLGACGADPGQHYSILDQDRYGSSVSGVPAAERIPC